MAKTNQERYQETSARSLEENKASYQQRHAEGKPCSVLERVILEQIRSSGAQEESDSCSGSRLDYGSWE